MKSLKGKLLVAAPTLLDPNFVQSVVLMVQHDENGALGLILNRQTEMSLKDAWQQVSETPCERSDMLYVGGPCEGVLMSIHTIEEFGQMEVLPGLWFATETRYIESLLGKKSDTPMRFFAGYSGWTGGQLEGEMESGSWQIAPATIERVFSPGQTLWRQIKREMSLEAIMGKVNPKIIPGDPSHN